MQRELDTVDRDEEESAKWGDFDDCFGDMTLDREAADEELDLASLPVALALDDFTRKDDIFEIEDCEFVIVKFFRGMKGHNIVERSNAVAYPADRRLCHRPIVTKDS